MVTAIFLHGGIFHLLMNAYALWIFGPVVERELGRVRFLLIFLTTGLFASAASLRVRGRSRRRWASAHRERSSASSARSSRTTTATASSPSPPPGSAGSCRS